MHELKEAVPLTGQNIVLWKIHLADFATQHLIGLISTWECVLYSCNDFHDECT